MRKETIGNCTLYLGKMEETIGIDNINHILTDPPYLYIKTHDFDKKWNEPLFFENAKRLLPDNGFIALFGRGTSFYRWNTRLAESGFIFKEEIVWDKRYTTAPCIALSRVHETISIHTKKTGKIRRAKVPYVEQKQFDVESIANDIKRIKSAINTEAGLNKVLAFLQEKKLYDNGAEYYKQGITVSNKLKDAPRELKTVKSICFGMNEKSIIKSQVTGGSGICVRKDMTKEDRHFQTIRMINGGMREKSVIELGNSHYELSHPTQKPVRLAERILALISDSGDIILDPFMGSGSFGTACIRTGRKYIGIEILPEYFDIACKRLEDAYLSEGY